MRIEKKRINFFQCKYAYLKIINIYKYACVTVHVKKKYLAHICVLICIYTVYVSSLVFIYV